MHITGAGADRDAAGALRPGRSRHGWPFTAPAVLLLLTQGPSYGYELASRLRPMLPRGAVLPDASVVYRLLRSLEGDGLLRSSWAENAGSGPARHVYELTDSGRDKLDGWASSIACEIHALSGLLTVYADATAERHRQ